MNKTIKTLIIEGDSWGCGAWTTITTSESYFGEKHESVYGVYHKGFEQYYLTDYPNTGLKNFSIPAKSLKQYFSKRVKAELSAIGNAALVFVTDPLRNLEEIDFNTVTSKEQIVEHSNRILDYEFYRWNNYNIPIFLIGGCAKVTDDMVKDYNNLHVVIPSCVEFFYPNKEQPLLWASSTWIKKLNPDMDTDCLKLIIDHAEEQEKFGVSKEALKYFWPDGMHPNHLGFLEIYEHTMGYLKNKGYSISNTKTLI